MRAIRALARGTNPRDAAAASLPGLTAALRDLPADLFPAEPAHHIDARLGEMASDPAPLSDVD